MSKKTIIADSSQISTFLECPMLWGYTYCTNIAPREQRPKDAMMKGSYGHKLLEIYYKAKAQNASMMEAIEAAIRFPIDKETNCVCGHAKESHSSLVLGSTELHVCKLCSGTPHYQHEFKNQPYPLSAPMRLEIQDRFRMYCMTYSFNDIKPHAPETVEVGFSECIYEDSEHLFVLEGKIDLLGSMGVEKVIMDHKWQERAHELYKKAVQFRNYSLITGTKMMLINYIRMARTTPKPFERKLVSFSTAEHIWWKQRLINIFFEMLKHKENMFRLESSQNWNSCKGSWGYECHFTTLCEERDLESVKLIKIKQNFVKREEWRPW